MQKEEIELAQYANNTTISLADTQSASDLFDLLLDKALKLNWVKRLCSSDHRCT